MLEGMIFLATGAIGETLNKWAEYGFFDYILPFLLIFAVLNGLLNQTKLFQDNKSINTIISLSVALMSLQFGFLSTFLAEIFPRLGIGLVIILVIIIIMGLFMPAEGWMTYILFGIGAIILAVILVQTAGALGWAGGYWWYENWEEIAWIVGIAVMIIIIANAGGPPSKSKNPLTNIIQSAINNIK